MAKFARGQVIPGGIGEAMVREEHFQFTPDGKFTFTMLKGKKGNLKQDNVLNGKYKLKNKSKTVVLTFNKVKKSEAREQNTVEEKKILYSKWYIPGDGTLQCYADTSIKFK